MKFSLVSATSVIALFSAAIGPAHAIVLATPDQTNIYDLVHDGVTSSDGGDGTVTRRDAAVTAVMALEAATIGWEGPSFTGPVDPSAVSRMAFPRIPLGAAPGTRPDDDFATPINGAWQWNVWQKAQALGAARIAPLVGKVGTATFANDRTGNTVFVAEASKPSFNDSASGPRGSSVAVAATLSSTSTATITVAGAGNFRQRGGSDFSVAAANSLQSLTPSDDQAPKAVVLTDAAEPTRGYTYAPASGPTTKGNVVEASFSNAVTANGAFADVSEPATPAKIQTSELQSGRSRPGQSAKGRVQTSEALPVQPRPGQYQVSNVVTTFSKVIDATQPFDGPVGSTQADGTRTFLSASVSANPSTTARLYMANVVNAAPSVPAGQTVEAFQIGPTPDPRAKGGAPTSVSDPLGRKILASVGPLNNSLALP